MRTLYLKQLLLILALSVGPAESARAQALQVTEVTQFDWGRLIDANTTWRWTRTTPSRRIRTACT